MRYTIKAFNPNICNFSLRGKRDALRNSFTNTVGHPQTK